MIKNKKEAIDNNFAITRPVEEITLNPIAIDARH